MKRFTILLSLFVVVALILVACGSEDPTATPEPAPEPTQEPAPEPTDEPEPEPEPESDMAPVEQSQIVDIEWQWADLVETEPAAQSVVPNPENYLLVFRTDGSANLKADCNNVSWTYDLSGNDLTFNTLGPSTLAFCGEDSLDQLYLASLGSTAHVALDGDRLKMIMADGAGEMGFNNGGPAEAAGGAPAEPEVVRWFVGPELVECTGVAPQMCMLIKENPEDEYSLFYDHIEGFDYEEGFEYEILVEISEVENPPADASSLSYTLVEEIDKREAEVDAGTGECTVNLEGETITFYQQAGLTGPLATILGPTFINGGNDAVAHINETGGICGAQIEINLTDTQYDPEQELAAYQVNREADPKPMFVLTYGSPATVALKEFTNEDHIVNVASGLNAEAFYVPREGWTVGTAPIYSDQFAGFVEWVSENWDDIKPEGAGDDIVVGVIGWAGSFGAGATTEEAIAYAESLGVTVLPLEVQDVSPTADVTGQLQNLLLQEANVVYIQSLGFGPAQVIGTLRALGVWDSIIVGSVNWAMNTDVITYLGENGAIANGYYGVFPTLWWNDTEEPGVQQALEDFEAGGYPETDKQVGYLLSYGSMFALADVVKLAINNVGFENLNGDAFFDAMKEMGIVDAVGLYHLDVQGDNRAPNMAQIRQAQANAEGQIEFVVIEDFFELPDTRPPAP